MAKKGKEKTPHPRAGGQPSSQLRGESIHQLDSSPPPFPTRHLLRDEFLTRLRSCGRCRGEEKKVNLSRSILKSLAIGEGTKVSHFTLVNLQKKTKAASSALSRIAVDLPSPSSSLAPKGESESVEASKEEEEKERVWFHKVSKTPPSQTQKRRARPSLKDFEKRKK